MPYKGGPVGRGEGTASSIAKAAKGTLLDWGRFDWKQMLGKTVIFLLPFLIF